MSNLQRKTIIKFYDIPVIKKWKKLVKSGNTLIEMVTINTSYIYHK